MNLIKKVESLNQVYFDVGFIGGCGVWPDGGVILRDEQGSGV